MVACLDSFGEMLRNQYRSSRPKVFCRKDVRINFSKYTGKHQCQSLFFNNGVCLQLY